MVQALHSQRIRDLGEKLDAHRKARQAAHPELTLTGIYNVLGKLRAGEPLSDKDKKIHDQGLVTILKQIHDDLDAAVFEAYGWSDLHQARTALRQGEIHDVEDGTVAQVAVQHPGDFEKIVREQEEALDQELLKRLVALNHERAAEEARGLVRWLRPDYQAPGSTPAPSQTEIVLPAPESSDSALPAPRSGLSWPKALSEQVSALQKLLPTLGPDPAALSQSFGRKSAARQKQITEILETLTALGKL